jgi:lysophospholipase
MEQYFNAHPDLTVGGVTWGWLDAALISMHKLQQKNYFETLKLPLLTITGGADHVTPPNELSHVIKRIPGAKHVIIPDARHDIMNESDVYRDQAWQQIDGFLSAL